MCHEPWLSCCKISSCTVAKFELLLFITAIKDSLKPLNCKNLVAPGVYTPQPLETSYKLPHIPAL